MGFKKYFVRLLKKVLTESHGSILICCPVDRLNKIDELKDGVSLDPKLDFLSAFSTYRKLSTAESLAKLQSCEKLLAGLLMCDGTVVFDMFGSVIAYRVFYRPNTPKVELTQVAIGGARRRAFDGIKELLRRGLVSALFRSQDGLTICERKSQ